MRVLIVRTSQQGYLRFTENLARFAVEASSLPVENVEGIVTYADPFRFNYDAFIFESAEPFDYAEAVSKIRAAGYTMPIIVVNAREGVRWEVQALDCGVDAYVVDQALNFDKLVAVLKAVIRGRQYGHENARKVLERELSHPERPQTLAKAS
jgi:DNA-binding response OmpR family regulator